MTKWQRARADATQIVTAALHTDSLPWAANTPKNQRMDLLRGYINKLTEQFIEDEPDETK